MSTLNSCSIFEPASPKASYIHIDSVSIVTDYPTQGSNSSKITDAWVFYDNVYLGTFPLPADIPLIGDGSHNIEIKGGILENGISGSRAAYPKYAAFDSVFNLSYTEKISISPKVSYGTGVQFGQLEDFDDASLSLSTTSAGSTALEVTQASDPNAFEGNSGMTTLTDTSTVFEVATSTPFTLPLSTPTYVELNYKGENDFTIGAIISTTNGIVRTDMVTARASSTWKKIYVNMSDLGGVLANGIDYKIYLRATKSTPLSTAVLYFDNLKVVY